jgi:hypothetical protein
MGSGEGSGLILLVMTGVGIVLWLIGAAFGQEPEDDL